MPILIDDEDAEHIIGILEGKGNVTLSAKLREKMAPVEHEEAFRQAAFERDHEDGVLEVDDGAIVSPDADGQGAYVQAWVWVSNEEARV